MKLQEIFDQLVSSEFSQLSIGGAESGVIGPSNYARVLNHVNLGLVALYKRFNLKEGSLKLSLASGLTEYKLSSDFSVQNSTSTEPLRYILDTLTSPFKDDILKVEKVLLDDGTELGLNDSSDSMSVFTPSALVLSIPDGLLSTQLKVVYRASHPKLVSVPGFDPTKIEVELPDSHLEPLLFFVASRAHNPVGMGQEFNAGNSYFGRYEQACRELENKGLQVDVGSSNTRLRRGGWV